MRFRLGTAPQGGTGMQSLQGGVGNFFSALAMAPLYKQQAAEEAETTGLKRELYRSQIAENLVKVAQQQAEERAAAQRPAMIETMAASRAGTSVPLFNQGLAELRSGPAPEGPPVIGGAIPADAFRTAVETLYGPAMATPADKTNWDQLANAAGRRQEQGYIDAIVQGRAPAAGVGQAYAATGGKPLIDAVGTTGVGFNRFTGQGGVIDQGLRTLFGNKTQADIARDRAAAGASSEAGKLSGARRSRVEQGLDKPITIEDDDGDASITTLPTVGEPVVRGKAVKKSGGVEATNAKARNQIKAAVEKELGPSATDAEIDAEIARRIARRPELSGGKAPAAAPAAAPAPAPAAPAAAQSSPPLAALKEGVNTKFKNGQTWTLRGGQAVRVQ